MHDQVYKLLVQIQRAWRWRWYGLFLAWFISCAGWVAIQFVPDRYMSSARVHIDTESMLRPLMKGIAADFNTNLLTRLSLVRRTLLSRPNLEQVMRMTDLDITARSEVDTERILGSLRARLQVKLEGRAENLFSVSFIDQDPELARDVVQALLTLFIETNLGSSREDLARTQRFLDDQIRDLTHQLESAENSLSSFRIENRDYLPGQGNIQDELSSATVEMEALELRRTEEIRVRDQVKRELAPVEDSFRASAPVSPQVARVTNLENQLQLLLIKYTDDHPDVLASRRILTHEKDILQASLNGDSSGENDVLPPRIELWRIQVAEHQTRIASMNRRAAQLQSKIEGLRLAVREIPVIESEFTRLQREYELVRTNHAALVSRRESARFAEELDTKTEPVQFRVVEPPNMPASPDAPNRPLLRAGALSGGLGVGVVFALFLSVVLQTIGTRQELEDFFRLPVVGSITVVPRPRDVWHRRTENLAFFGVLAGLFGAALLVHAGLPEWVFDAQVGIWYGSD